MRGSDTWPAIESSLITSELGLAPLRVPTPGSPLSQPTSAAPQGYFTPELAIQPYLADYGVDYVGDCSVADLNRDVGKYCSQLYEDRGGELLYLVGPTFSEAEAWILVEQHNDGSWAAIDDMAVEYDELG